MPDKIRFNKYSFANYTSVRLVATDPIVDLYQQINNHAQCMTQKRGINIGLSLFSITCNLFKVQNSEKVAHLK